MEFIAHRVNTIGKLKLTPAEYGVELVLRDYGDKLILAHDPFTGTMILNVKSERIEYEILSLLQKYNIKDYFFLDSSFPMIYLLSKDGEKNIALRFSEFEGLDTILNMKNKIKWVWVDCFSILPINKKVFDILKNNNFKLCLVSPDLQGQESKIEKYRDFLNKNNIYIDAI